jgi:endonuclease/exonuclease/phosphatase family metal-dependent hydrolase
MFRIATYNIQKSIGLDGRRQPQRILEVLRELDADIVALQEVDRRFGRRMTSLPPELIAEHTDYRAIPFAARHGSLGWHGNAILVRSSIELLDHRRLTIPMVEPRGAVLADISVQGRPLRVVATHLSLIGACRKLQIASIMAQLHDSEDDYPVVVLGDLNEWRRPSRRLRGLHPHYRVVSPGHSFPSALPTASLDRIITSPEIAVHVAGVHRSEKSRIASDHLPVWAQLSFAEGAGAHAAWAIPAAGLAAAPAAHP